MKFLILFLSTLTLFQSVHAGTLLKCSVDKRPQALSGLNLFLKDSSTLSAYLFFREKDKVRLEGTYSSEIKMESWFYGSDINRPAGQRPIKIISSTIFGERYSTKVELRFSPDSSNSVVSGRVTVLDQEVFMAKDQRITCDVSESN